jgi:hypothetical protein
MPCWSSIPPPSPRRGRVERWRGCLGQAHRLPALSSAGASLAWPCPVSTSRSSNRTSGFAASGSRRRHHEFAHGKLCRRTVRSKRTSTSGVLATQPPTQPAPHVNSHGAEGLNASASSSLTSWSLPSLGRVAPSIAPGLVSELLGSSPISGPLPLVALPPTRVPSLHRHYPASAVLRTHPPPYPARPVPRGLPVDHVDDHRAGLPVLHLRSVQTCRRHYPGGIVSGAVARYPPRCQPSPFGSRFGSRINIFEACSAFTHVTACLFAGSPEATLSTRGFDGFVTSTAAPIATGRSDPVAGRDLHPLDLSTFARRTTEECLSRGAFHF